MSLFGETAVALFAFEPSERDELELSEGDIIIVLARQEDDWWLVQMDDLVGLIPSTHVKIRENSGGNRLAYGNRLAPSSDGLPPGWDSWVDAESGDTYYFNESTGITQWELPVDLSYPTNSKGKNTDNGNSVAEQNETDRSLDPTMDLLRFQQLRKEADIRIDDLRKSLSNNEKDFPSEKPHLLNPLINPLINPLANPLKTPEKRTASGKTPRDHSAARVCPPRSKNTSLPALQTGETSPVKKNIRQLSEKSGRQLSEIKKSFSGKSENRNSRTPQKSPVTSASQIYRQIENDYDMSPLEGVRYPHCRSVVFSPSVVPSSSSRPPVSTLSLQHVYGYDGDVQKHRGLGGGKNILHTGSKVVYPAAAVVVVMSTDTQEQGFFLGHTGNVTALCLHPDRKIVASGQTGRTKDLILVWDSSVVSPGDQESESIVQLHRKGDKADKADKDRYEESSDSTGVMGLSFSGDGKLLLALLSGEGPLSSSICVFDWSKSVTLISAKVGHMAVQVAFDPYRGPKPFKPTPRSTPISFSHSSPTAASQSSVSEGDGDIYSIVTCGGRVMKFWTLRRDLTKDDSGSNSEAEGSKSPKIGLKQKRRRKVNYILDGSPVSWPKGSIPDDLLCFTFVSDSNVSSVSPVPLSISPSISASISSSIYPSTRQGGVGSSRVFSGSALGAVYIWQQIDSSKAPENWRNQLEGSRGHLEGKGQERYPLPRGKLVSVVTDVHDGPVTDIEYYNSFNPYASLLSGCGLNSVNGVRNSGESEHKGEENNGESKGGCKGPGASGLSETESIVTCGSDGVVNRWLIERGDSLPLEHVATSSIEGEDKGTGRSLAFSADGCRVAVGTTGNAILLLTFQTGVEIASSVLLSSHSGKIRKLAVNDYRSHQSDLFTTVSADDSVRIWDSNTNKQIAMITHPSPCAATFTPDGTGLVIGNRQGEIVIVSFKILGAVISDNIESEITFQKNISGKLKKSESPKRSSGSSPKRLKKGEIIHLKYSPNGLILAAGCRDGCIHFLSVRNMYKRTGVCKGHVSSVTEFDFSEDSGVLQSTDVTSKEILYWDVSSAKQISAASARDIKWESWTCCMGWPVQGVTNGINGELLDSDAPTVSRSNGGSILAAGGSALKLFRYPCLAHSTPHVYKGNTSSITDVSFLSGDRGLLSVDSAGCYMFQWAIKKS